MDADERRKLTRRIAMVKEAIKMARAESDKRALSRLEPLLKELEGKLE